MKSNVYLVICKIKECCKEVITEGAIARISITEVIKGHFLK